MGKALYRKYRARQLSEIVGQDHITAPLAESIKSGKISHAYLFTGPRGTGKTSIARILAHEINGIPYELEDSHIDIIEIDAASNRGIDDIRELREKVSIVPTISKYKVYIIDEVHMLTKEAFNALLKTIEEPPEHAIFILATTDPQKIPITILSRTQQYHFQLADPKTMTAHLRTISDTEKFDIDDASLQIIARHGGGSFRDSISLLDQLTTVSQSITSDKVLELLGLPDPHAITDILDHYRSGDFTAIHTAINSLLMLNKKPENIAGELITEIIHSPSPELLPLLDKLLSVARSSHAHAQLLLAFYSPETTVQPTLSAAPTPSAPRQTTTPPPKQNPAPTPTQTPPKARSKLQDKLKRGFNSTPAPNTSAPEASPETNGTLFDIMGPVQEVQLNGDVFDGDQSHS
jgi:DNA polymerase-3 subunit gamma/tau